MQIRPISIFAKRISYQSTCVKVRTTSNCGILSVLETKNCDYYSEEFSIEETSKSNCALSVSPASLTERSVQHRMPVVAAVVAHRRIYPAASTLASSTAGSQRSSCAVRLSALSVLTPQLGATGVRKTSTAKYARGSGSFSFAPPAGIETARGGRPLIELKQIGTSLLKSPPKNGAVVAESKRYYAKGRDKPKSKNTKVVVNEHEMAEVIDVNGFRKQLDKLMEEMRDDFTKQLNVRGASGALETLQVEFEGEVYPLQELAQVGRKNPQLAVLNLASLPDAIKPVLNAIEGCGMNLNPQQDGTTIFVPLPKVTREHRETLAKNAKALFVKYKTAMQAVQNKYVKQAKNQSDLSDDLVFSVTQQIMKFTESYVLEAEKLMQLKQKELLENK